MKVQLKSSTIKNTFLFWLVTFNFLILNGQSNILPGANQFWKYIDKLEQKNIAIVAHNASFIKNSLEEKHLVDFLLEKKIKLLTIFAPEHGFRGTADAGEKITNHQDPKTGIPIISLYGKNKKPQAKDIQGLDIMIFDLQDVGVRFYTYLSTLHYVMEACAENNIELIVLDRPNPNIHYVDGPVLQAAYSSFVGLHPVPIVYGMTIGEYAKMINGEGWLKGSIQADLTIIPVQNYSRDSKYELPIRPSPNLPNSQSVALYPSLCLLEPTVISVGRGTDFQFQIYGHPLLPKQDFSFTPRPNFGSKNPKHNGRLCFGEDLSKISHPQQLELKWLIRAYKNFPNPDSFFLEGFNRIIGNGSLKEKLISGQSEKEIRNNWRDELKNFENIRNKYLIYP